MYSTYFTLFNFIAAAAFMAMWFEDKQRKYLFFWGIAHALIPGIVFASIALNNQVSPSFSLIPALYAFCSSAVSVSMVVAAMHFRSQVINKPLTTMVFAVLAVAIWLLASMLPFHQLTIFGSCVMVTSYLAVAWILWSKSLAERIASAFFVLRAVIVIGFFLLIDFVEPSLYAELLVLLSAVSAILNAILLLIISFFQTTDDLKRNLQFFNVLHAISAKTRMVNSEQELAEKVIGTMLQLPFWISGVLMKVSADQDFLTLIHAQGDSNIVKETLQDTLVPISGTLSEQVIQTGKPVVVTNNSLKSLNLNAVLRKLHERSLIGLRLHLVVPISNRGKTTGILVLTDSSDRDVFPQEMATLMSIGEVIGTAIENMKHLRTLNFRASHDSLTGLSNRSMLHEHCQQVLAFQPLILMLFDLDNFKEVNDVFGHDTGDKLLQSLAQRLNQAVAKNGELFRLGGDEFVVVYPQAAVCPKPESLAEELLTLIKQPLAIGDLRFECAASLGVVNSQIVGNDSHELLRCADLAMYKAKHSEKSIAYYDKSHDLYMRERFELLGDVNAGLAKQEFELFYQPLINLTDGSCVLCEGLLRWHHPKRGLLKAADFIPMVELTEQISFLSYRVIELALQTIATWREQGINIKIAINLSARNFLDPDLPAFLIDTAQTHKVSPHSLQLEITETVLMKDPQAAELIIHRLHEAGFTIALDDFGTGYSSLAYLAKFPISAVKIDRSFVADMVNNERSKNIVEATIDLTHKLGFSVTAEGVENKNTEDLLKHLNCDNAQGYWYSEPVEKAQFETWFRHYAGSKVEH